MSNLSQFLGGGLTPKFQEFTSSGTFTPSQALIDAGGYIEVFLVGGGCKTSRTDAGGAGGETILTQMYLTSTTGITVTIAAGSTAGSDGGNSFFGGSSAGGVNITAKGGSNLGRQIQQLGATFSAISGTSTAAGSGLFGYGGGGARAYTGDGVYDAKANSGQGASVYSDLTVAGSGYCLIKWYE